MKAIVLINAAPGFEDAVEAALDGTDGVRNRVREKVDNYDIAALLEAEDANRIQDILNAIRHESGVQGLEIVKDPDRDLLKRLRPT